MRGYSININYIMFFMLVYPFFRTYYLSELGIMPIFDQYLFVFMTLSIIAMYCLKLPYIYFNSGIFFIIGYYIIVIYSTYQNSTFELEKFSMIAFSISFALLLNYSVRNKKRFLYFLSAIYVQIYIYVILNLLSILLFPNGIPSISNSSSMPYYLFGNTNSVIKVILPGLCFALLYDLLKYGKIKMKSWMLLMLVWVTHILTSSITSLIGLFVLTVFLLKRFGKKLIFFNYFPALITSISIFILIVIVRYESEVLSNFVGLFGKDLTFTNRDILWRNTINSIKESPLIGYGFLNSDEQWFLTGNTSGSHNYYLDTLLRSGIIGGLYLLSGLIYFGIKITSQRNNAITRTILGVVCAYFVMWVSEPFSSKEYLMFGVQFVLLSNIGYIQNYYNDTFDMKTQNSTTRSVEKNLFKI